MLLIFCESSLEHHVCNHYACVTKDKILKHANKCFQQEVISRTTVAWLRRLVAVLLPRRPGFAPWSVHMGFVDKVSLGQVFLRVPRFSPANIIPPWLSILM
jgi:hypothetical protein